MQVARFHGQLDDQVGTGEYDIELALWTPDSEGNRTYVTSENVTLVVTREMDSILESVMGVALVILAISLVILGYVMVLVLRKKGIRMPGTSGSARMGRFLRPLRGLSGRRASPREDIRSGDERG
jgi:hypothetical protein